MNSISSKLIFAYGIALAFTVVSIVLLAHFGMPTLLPSAVSFSSLIPDIAMNPSEVALPPNIGSKAVIISFDDGWASQYTAAKPILDRFGIKATFFITCNLVGKDSYMSWDQVKALQREGHDIQSHSMDHRDLTRLSLAMLEYEVGQSKECLHEKGIESRIFAVPYNNAWINSTVIDTIARHYDFAKNGNDDVMYLYCHGRDRESIQVDCRTYQDGELTVGNRYSIRAWSHNYYDEAHGHDNARIFEAFVNEVNDNYYDLVAQTESDSAKHIPILEYHRIDGSGLSTSTDPLLFFAEMQYLYDNGFKVLTMDDLHYDSEGNFFYVE